MQQGRSHGKFQVGPLLLPFPKRFIEHTRVQVAFAEGLMFHQRLMEGDVVADAADAVLAQGRAHALDGLQARGTPSAQLADQGVVEHGHLGALIDSAVVAHIAPAGRAQEGDSPRTRHEVPVWIFGIDAAFHGPAVQGNFLLGHGQFFTAGHEDLPLDEIKARDPFRDGMLHLQAGVHLQKVEVAVGVRQELHGAGAHVVHRPGHLQGRFAHGLAHLRRDVGAGGLLNHLLMAPLHGAFPLVQVDMIAVGVREDLDLDVTGPNDGLLHIDAVVAEGRQGLAPGPGQG